MILRPFGEPIDKRVEPIDALLDALADRLADRVADRLAKARAGDVTCAGLLSTSQAAEHLGCGRHELYNQVALGKLRAIRMGKRSLRFAIKDLDAWVERHRR
jgi:excisionase family DNA binding protein